nr:MAG TPA: hypothetical protein [Caudoviricetes sp.]
MKKQKTNILQGKRFLLGACFMAASRTTYGGV